MCEGWHFTHVLLAWGKAFQWQIHFIQIGGVSPYKSLWLIDWFLELSATFSNISAIPWRPALVVEEVGVPGENHRPWASKW